MWQLPPFFKSPGSGYQARAWLYLRKQPACWKSPRFARFVPQEKLFASLTLWPARNSCVTPRCYVPTAAL